MLDWVIGNWKVELVLAVIALILIKGALQYLALPSNFPPGPWGIPVLGFVPFVGGKPHITFLKLREKYGDVFSISLGPYPTVVLTSFSAVKEALLKQNDAFAGRHMVMVPRQFKQYPGIVSNTGEMWSVYRRFSLATLRDFGFGKSTIEPQILEELYHFKKKLLSYNGQPVNLNKELILGTINVISTVLNGERFEYNDPTLLKIVHLIEEQMNATTFGSIEACLPEFLRRPKLLRFFRIPSGFGAGLELLDVYNKIVDKYEKLYQSGNENSFISSWFTEMEKVGPNDKYINKLQLPAILRDITIGASDTTANSLSWLCLYMIKHPDIQTKVQKEIDDVIGRRTPSMTDQVKMPYTEATINELHRCASIVPLSVPHSTTTDTTLNGYFIPKDTMIFPNLWGIHHDPEIFPDPFEFKPERFLTDANQIKKLEELIPFSLGKRQCMGKSLARMEMFLFFTSLLQTFTFRKVEGAKLDFDYKYAIISMPNHQEICAIPRRGIH